MIAEIDPTGGDCCSAQKSDEGKKSTLGQADRRMRRRWLGGVAAEEEEREGKGKKGHKLGMRRWHAITLAVHFCDGQHINPSQFPLIGSGEGSTLRTLLFDKTFEKKIQRLATHLPRKHEKYLSFPGRPDQRHVDHAKSLRDQGKPCAKIRHWVVGVLDLGLASHWV